MCGSNWTLVARRLRRYTIAAEDSLTVPEFFERRFADGTGALRTVAGVLTIFFIVFYTNSGLIAGADLMGSVFEVDLAPGIWITLFAVTSYTFIGGLFLPFHAPRRRPVPRGGGRLGRVLQPVRPSSQP